MNRHVEIALNYLIGDPTVTEAQAAESARIALRYAEIVRERGFVLHCPAFGWTIRADYFPADERDPARCFWITARTPNRAANLPSRPQRPFDRPCAPAPRVKADPDALLAAWQSFIDHLLTLPEASEPGVAAMLADAREALYR